MALDPLISPEEALDFVLAEARARALAADIAPLANAGGRVLAESVHADIDLPPFDKALVDGFAIRSSDAAPGATLRVVGEILAGTTLDRPLGPGEAVSIMTGAPLPPGADAVVMIEKTDVAEGCVTLRDGIARPGQNRLERGKEFRSGDLLLEPGLVLNAPRLGVAASVGRTELAVARRPRAAFVGTGDEIVPIGVRPEPGQIRDSNSTGLATLLSGIGAGETTVETVPDRIEALIASFTRALGTDGSAAPRDLLLVGGGVSAGKKDLVPAALEAAGARKVFHKLRLKPGKPLWFGVGPKVGDHPGTLVFGLPGNPVSGLVCALLFAAPAVRAMSGRPTNGFGLDRRALALDFEYEEDRPTFRPARLTAEGRVAPLAWAGSSDLRAAAEADGFVALEPGRRRLEAGTIVGFLPIP